MYFAIRSESSFSLIYLFRLTIDILLFLKYYSRYDTNFIDKRELKKQTAVGYQVGFSIWKSNVHLWAAFSNEVVSVNVIFLFNLV